MTFKREMEKAIKGVLKPLGYKYVPKYYNYEKYVDDDIIHALGFIEETHFRPGYYYLKTIVSVAARSLNEVLYEVTNGIIDYRERSIGPVYIWGIGGNKYTHSEFIKERPMDENIADFDRMIKGDVQRIYDRYDTLKKIYTSAAHDEYYNQGNTPCLWFYAPLSFFFLGEYDEVFKFIDERLGIENDKIERLTKRFGHVDAESTMARDAFLNMRDNLKKWIAEGRQFKVDDEYLPKH